MKNMGDIYRNDIGIGQTQQTIKREHISYPYGCDTLDAIIEVTPRDKKSVQHTVKLNL